MTKKTNTKSISLKNYQLKFLEDNPKFNFSKYVQMMLDEYIGQREVI